MKRLAILICCGMAAAFGTSRCHAALPTLSGLADAFENLQGRYAETTNALAETRTRLANITNRLASVVALIESRGDLREMFHGGRIGQYVFSVTNATPSPSGKLRVSTFRIDLYGDGSVHTNNAERYVAIIDPEAAAKAVAEAKARAEAIQAAWERANLPPHLAAIREAQRQAMKTNVMTVVVEGN